MRVYIGWDAREAAAYQVARASLLATSPGAVPVKLDADKLRAQGLYTRLQDARGVTYDLASGAHCATAFAITRFLVLLLEQDGWVLFTDCDVLFQADVQQLLALADPGKAVMVVQHAPLTSTLDKMDGQPQQVYARKNWSSVMLFNCSHPANQRLSLRDINERPGRDLHRFYWLHDSEIGALPAQWNWLVGVTPQPAAPGIAHFTLGGPWLPDWPGAPHDHLWLAAQQAYANRLL